MIDLGELQKQLEAAVGAINKNVGEVDKHLASGEGDFEHPHELRAMLMGIKRIAEFVLGHGMDIQAIKMPEGQVILKEALTAHRCYDAVAGPNEREAHDFEDTTFFLTWLLELPPHCLDT